MLGKTLASFSAILMTLTVVTLTVSVMKLLPAKEPQAQFRYNLPNSTNPGFSFPPTRLEGNHL
jgi:hypothetical protein